jgi:hypothetical protein
MQSLVAFIAAFQSPALIRLEDVQPYQDILDKYLELSYHSPIGGFKNMRSHINNIQRIIYLILFYNLFSYLYLITYHIN